MAQRIQRLRAEDRPVSGLASDRRPGGVLLFVLSKLRRRSPVALTVLLLFSYIFFNAAELRADPIPPARPLGIGVILGDPSGLTLKSRMSARNALQLHVGFDLGEKGSSGLTLVLDYLFNFTGVGVGEAGTLVPYAGIGGKLGVREKSDSVALGVLVPLGLSFFIRGAPVEIALEIGIGLYVIPGTHSLVDAGLAGRWYF